MLLELIKYDFFLKRDIAYCYLILLKDIGWDICACININLILDILENCRA